MTTERKGAEEKRGKGDFPSAPLPLCPSAPSLDEPTLVRRPDALPLPGTPAAVFMAQVAARARELCAFYLTHKNRRVFVEGHDERWIFRYVTFHLLAGNALVVRAGGVIAGVAFAWPERAAAVLARAQTGQAQFNWRQLDGPGDAVFVGPLIGDRSCGYGWRKLALQRWPDLSQRRIFAERRGRLVELSPRLFKRFGRPRKIPIVWGGAE